MSALTSASSTPRSSATGNKQSEESTQLNSNLELGPPAKKLKTQNQESSTEDKVSASFAASLAIENGKSALSRDSDNCKNIDADARAVAAAGTDNPHNISNLIKKKTMGTKQQPKQRKQQQKRPKYCHGWSGAKFDALFRQSMVDHVENVIPSGTLSTLPSALPLEFGIASPYLKNKGSSDLRIVYQQKVGYTLRSKSCTDWIRPTTANYDNHDDNYGRSDESRSQSTIRKSKIKSTSTFSSDTNNKSKDGNHNGIQDGNSGGNNTSSSNNTNTNNEMNNKRKERRHLCKTCAQLSRVVWKLQLDASAKIPSVHADLQISPITIAKLSSSDVLQLIGLIRKQKNDQLRNAHKRERNASKGTGKGPRNTNKPSSSSSAPTSSSNLASAVDVSRNGGVEGKLQPPGRRTKSGTVSVSGTTTANVNHNDDDNGNGDAEQDAVGVADEETDGVDATDIVNTVNDMVEDDTEEGTSAVDAGASLTDSADAASVAITAATSTNSPSTSPNRQQDYPQTLNDDSMTLPPPPNPMNYHPYEYRTGNY